MANYLLLRNNKESGPFSVDDLMELGLKPYDLVWVQGKSAAWRYPSEVEELKPFAPIVEEQPFDRFYKKSGTTQETKSVNTADTKKELYAEAEEPQVKVITAVKPEETTVKAEHEKYIPKKSVYVTMPGQKITAAKEPIEKTLPSSPVQPTITISENPAAAKIKYSQPLDEIKEMYVKTLHDRKQKIARKSFWMQNLKKAAALLSLVAVGLILGFVIKSNGNKQKDFVQQEKVSPSQMVKSEPPIIAPDTPRDTIIANTLAASPENVQAMHQPTGGFVNKNPAQQEKTIEPNRPTDKPLNNDITKKEIVTTPLENKMATSLAAPGLETDPATGERNRKVRSGNNETPNTNKTGGITEKKSFLNDNISRMVSVKSNEYKKVAFGGIRDLQLTVTNDSKYILDNVTVELQYIKPNELPLKTENIQFTSVGPNATSTIRVPDTNRGIKVVFRIINVKSRQMDESVAGN